MLYAYRFTPIFGLSGKSLSSWAAARLAAPKTWSLTEGIILFEGSYKYPPASEGSMETNSVTFGASVFSSFFNG